ncbi:calcium/calmodulin-dependent protein kinase type IV-like [Symsagittifera roscoffensis]|uniref:calcium/calmodulin-dependent protein kinase type IV-like n=1 Tax=Symsagittifera roscoffensis TaxID=84072 RepID=UPI00307B9B0D
MFLTKTPEILCSVGYDEKIDVWSAGVILYILLCGYEPFSDESDDDKVMFKKILNGAYEFHAPEWDEISESAKDLVRKMLVVDPAKRLSVNAAVNHPWIVGETKSTKELHDVTNKLRLFNSKRRLKTPMNAIAVVNAFKFGNHHLRNGSA